MTTAILIVSGISLQAKDFNCQNLGGATGLINTPTANTSWESNQFGIDVGFSALTCDDGEYMTRVTGQLFRIWEVGMLFDNQDGDDSNDWIFHTKIRFYGSGNSAIAVGGNLQLLEENDKSYTVGQAYLATTYASTFFGLPAETSLVVGKTFGESENDSDIDFSMGFDLDMFPSVFKGYVHWINDFTNYAYQARPHDFDDNRGIFSTGARIAFPLAGKFKINIDALLIDLLDDTREFGLTIAGGMAF